MKQFILIIFFISTLGLASAQVKIGQQVTDAQVGTLLNAPVKSTGLAALKGKVILLEFWATWCSPCVEAMGHLQKLQKTYAGKFQVITVSTEKEKRVKQFLINQPSNLWFAIDTADNFGKYFPYHIIPHSVLIDENGTVVAITEPQNITAKVIADVIQGIRINLPLKEDTIRDENPWDTYFPTDTNTQSRFLIQPEIKGAGSSSKSYQQSPVFKNRRICMINVPLEIIYRIAYGNFSNKRTIDQTPNRVVKEDKQNYCMDIIVPKGQEKMLFTTLQNELKTRFELQASIEKRVKPVYILTIADSAKVNLLNRSHIEEKDFDGGSGSFNGESVRLNCIADYLENFGLVNRPVLDETGNNNLYNIKFTYMAEKKGDLQNALHNLGLKLIEAERNIDMLVLR
ncbi:TIGR03435 family protein [Mucilaginibacter polytrichastri]|uniref:Thioredoxin domain-containing protein n=1 Tax=Mucilaginibacter polytrichastri TaxID=1302689 RepID=A0A1Q6A3M5_9SPHI|nr:TIGR03435 family protein [Mucilaginibacter polytrichastri]OKS88606.1 hypothetical protein RG47T_4077 [Mucilaginibacter polytrichastri]SFT11185.1 soil-associated protein, TIGR03435 family [Mucilaginibacter polytrichastri]